MRSMTGFGQGSAEGDRFRVSVTLRGVNHRYLDLVLRLKDEVRPAERELRQMLTEELKRGRVEVVYEIEVLGERAVEVAIDRGLASSLKTAVAELAEAHLMSADIRLEDLLRVPDAVRITAKEEPWRPEDLRLLFDATASALGQLAQARAVEGAALEAVIRDRVAGLRDLHREMVGCASNLPEQLAQSLKQRVQQLMEGGTMPDETRLAQEVALYVDRTDVSEELDRLASHLGHFDEIAAAEGSVGKRLDFLSQEIFRELNTIGSKCRDAPLVRHVLDAKVLVEQIREQVQNVE